MDRDELHDDHCVSKPTYIIVYHKLHAVVYHDLHDHLLGLFKTIVYHELVDRVL